MHPSIEFNSVIITDEIEIEENSEKEQGLIVHFNGIYIEHEKALFLQYDFHPFVDMFSKKGFHAKDVFKEKSDENYYLMNNLTDIIIKHRLIWINFGFSKRTMKDEGLKPLFDMEFPNIKFQKNNYKAVGFFLYVSSIHFYQEKHKIFKPKIRIYTDKDEYLKVGTELSHDGVVWKNIERIFATRGKYEPFLYLSDFVGFIFRRVKTYIGNDLKDIESVNFEELDNLTRMCLFCIVRIVKSGLFKYFNFWEIMPTEKS